MDTRATVAIFCANAMRRLYPKGGLHFPQWTRDLFADGFQDKDWHGRVELRPALPMLSDLYAGPYYVGDGSALKEMRYCDGRLLESMVCSKAYWICLDEYAQSRKWHSCSHADEFTSFYGEDVYVCTMDIAA